MPPAYRQIGMTGPPHARLFQIGVWLEDRLLGEGEGSNKQQAEQAAARAALTALGASPAGAELLPGG